MTVQEIIDRVDRVKSNAYTNDDKLMWLNEVEGRVQTEIFLLRIDEVKQIGSVMDELLVPFPYDMLYDFYLQAMVDFHNREYNEYANTSELFNQKWNDFELWYTTHYPTRGKIEFGETRIEVKENADI